MYLPFSNAVALYKAFQNREFSQREKIFEKNTMFLPSVGTKALSFHFQDKAQILSQNL